MLFRICRLPSYINSIIEPEPEPSTWGLAVADGAGAPLGAWTFNLSFNLATSLYSEDLGGVLGDFDDEIFCEQKKDHHMGVS